MTRRKKAMEHFKNIGLSSGEKLMVMRKLVITWKWLDSEKENTK